MMSCRTGFIATRECRPRNCCCRRNRRPTFAPYARVVPGQHETIGSAGRQVAPMKSSKRNWRAIGFALLGMCWSNGHEINAQVDPKPDVIIIDAKAASHPFPHFWERMFGSGRAILSLRDSYRHDLRAVKDVTDFEYLRFHAIFHDEVGVYDEDSQGQVLYNFSYVDQIYDGLLAAGVRPFVEISFMPNKLAAKNILHSFRYKPNISPPKNWTAWDGLISAFTRHLVDRYGIDEVAQWYFEVWNEPNLDFWAGEPRQAT